MCVAVFFHSDVRLWVSLVTLFFSFRLGRCGGHNSITFFAECIDVMGECLTAWAWIVGCFVLYK
jgi:hypothetical protein